MLLVPFDAGSFVGLALLEHAHTQSKPLLCQPGSGGAGAILGGGKVGGSGERAFQWTGHSGEGMSLILAGGASIQAAWSAWT